MQSHDHCLACNSKVDCLRCHFKTTHPCTHSVHSLGIKEGQQHIDASGVDINLTYQCGYCKIEGTQYYKDHEISTLTDTDNYSL